MKTNNTIEDIYKLCEQLDLITEKLYSVRRRIKFYVLTVGAYICATAIVSYYVYKLVSDYIISDIVFSCVIVLIVCSLLLYLWCFSTAIKKYVSVEHEGAQILSEIIELVDWQEFRKQQLYKGPDKEILISIQRYYYENQSMLSPTKKRVGLVKCVRFLSVIASVVLVIQSLYYIFIVLFD